MSNLRGLLWVTSDSDLFCGMSENQRLSKAPKIKGLCWYSLQTWSFNDYLQCFPLFTRSDRLKQFFTRTSLDRKRCWADLQCLCTHLNFKVCFIRYLQTISRFLGRPHLSVPKKSFHPPPLPYETLCRWWKWSSFCWAVFFLVWISLSSFTKPLSSCASSSSSLRRRKEKNEDVKARDAARSNQCQGIRHRRSSLHSSRNPFCVFFFRVYLQSVSLTSGRLLNYTAPAALTKANKKLIASTGWVPISEIINYSNLFAYKYFGETL